MGARSAHARVRGRPEGGGDGFLLSQERRWNHVVPAQAGTQRGEVERRGLPRVPGMDSCFRRKDGGTTSCPRKRVPRGGRWSVGASHAFQGWIPAFAGKTVEPRRARASGYPEGGGGASGPLTRPRDGFLLSQEWLRGAVVMPVTRRGGSRTAPTEAGVYRSLRGFDMLRARNPRHSPQPCLRRNDGGGPSCRRLSAPAGRTRRRRSLQLRPGASGDRRR